MTSKKIIKGNVKINTLHLVKMINEQDTKVAFAVGKKSKEIAKAIDICVDSISKGGKIIYAGAGTSGRLGILDASEMYPTYGNANWIKAVIAGGSKAIKNSLEYSEDNKEDAINDLKNLKLKSDDIVIGITSSGTTPYTISVIQYAKRMNIKTISITTTPDSEITKLVDINIDPLVGPEIILGSTRMKSGSAQKFILNTISTGIMIKMGKTFGNIMINVQPKNSKLILRSIDIIMNITSLTHEKAKLLFNKSDSDIKRSLVMHFLSVSKSRAIILLKNSNNSLKILFTDEIKQLTTKQRRQAKPALIIMEKNYDVFKIHYINAYKIAEKGIENTKTLIFNTQKKILKKTKIKVNDTIVNIKKKLNHKK